MLGPQGQGQGGIPSLLNLNMRGGRGGGVSRNSYATGRPSGTSDPDPFAPSAAETRLMNQQSQYQPSNGAQQ